MSGGVEFPAASVLQHAEALSAVSDHVGQARSAVREVTMDGQAFGQLCQFLPGLLSPLFSSAVEVLNDAVEALDETALKLRSTATAMETADAGSAGRLERSARSTLELPL